MNVKWTKEYANSWVGTSGNVTFFLDRLRDDKHFSGCAEYFVDDDNEVVFVEVRVPPFNGIRVGLAQDYVVQEARKHLTKMLNQFK